MFENICFQKKFLKTLFFFFFFLKNEFVTYILKNQISHRFQYHYELFDASQAFVAFALPIIYGIFAISLLQLVGKAQGSHHSFSQKMVAKTSFLNLNLNFRFFRFLRKFRRLLRFIFYPLQLRRQIIWSFCTQMN